MVKEIRCVCCGNKLENGFASSLFCSSCAVFHSELKNRANNLNTKLKKYIKKCVMLQSELDNERRKEKCQIQSSILKS